MTYLDFLYFTIMSGVRQRVITHSNANGKIVDFLL